MTEEASGTAKRSGWAGVRSNHVAKPAKPAPPFCISAIAVQALAKWLHPELFKDLDPDQTRRELYQRFMPIPASGVFATSLKP